MMRRTDSRSALFALALASAACGGDDHAPTNDAEVFEIADDVTPETAIAPDGDTAEALDGDTAEAPDDADAQDQETVVGPSVPLAGFGVISGDCGVLDDELLGPAPSFFVNHLDFGADGWDPDAELALLTAGGQQMWSDGNAGGSSLESEIFAFEVLARCELATLVKTETEVDYDVEGKKTDILVAIDDHPIGVSVTRAVSFPFDTPYTVEAARDILEKKLADIQVSSANVASQDRWLKQILHVLAYDAPHVASLEAAWAALSDDLRGDTIIIVTVTDGDDAVIY